MRYQYLLVDNDNTLMDFDTAEHLALLDTLTAFSLPATREVLETYHAINHALWEALERGEVTQAQLKLRRFEQLIDHFGWMGVEACALADTYPKHLGCHAELLPGALELLQALHGRMKIALVSNGVDYSIIRAIVKDCLESYMPKVNLNESASLDSIAINKNGQISFIDTKGNIFTAKLQKTGNINEGKIR